MTESQSTLHDKCAAFADELSDTVASVLPNPPQFTARVREPHVLVSVLDGLDVQSFPLTISGVERLHLEVTYYITWDSKGEFLAVHDSRISCEYPSKNPEPLFRYEYRRDWEDPPGAHLHVHAHRDEVPYLLRVSEANSKKLNHRKEKLPALSEIHFHLGGHRYRPCLEEVLWMLIREFGIDHADGWKQALTAGIERWREYQLRSAVRDNPQVAAEALEAMQIGYEVKSPGGGAPKPRPRFPLP